MRHASAGLFALVVASQPIGGATLAVNGVLSSRATHFPARRTTDISLLEAFDLVPVMDCLKLDGMDAVERCMDNLEPWLAINDDGDVSFSINAINGFIGGSVGVIGTVLSTMVKKEEVKDRLKCNYCAGSGQILCGHCLSTGVVTYLDDDGKLCSMPCPNCEGTGTVVCINCQGSGISIPEEVFQVLGDEEMGFTEEDYIGLFDEMGSTGTSIRREPVPTPDAAPIGAASGSSSSSSKGDEVPPKPTDFSGGMG